MYSTSKFNSWFLTFVVAIVFFSSITLAAFNASNVPIDTRANWCTNQVSSCQNLCYDEGNNVTANDCDPETLDYHCICSNGYQPNSTEYTQTVPYFICIETEDECNKDCTNGDSNCYNNCKMNCSATSPKKYNQSNATNTFGGNDGSSGTTTAPTNFNNSVASATANASFVIFLTALILMFNRL